MWRGEQHEILACKRLLIFDFDGTIADTIPLHAQAFTETLAPLGIEVDYSSIAGRKTRDALLLCFATAGRAAPNAASLEALTAEKQRRARALIGAELKPLPGVDDFLRWAKPRYLMALVTSGSQKTVELALQKLGYQGLFDLILFAEDVMHAKPHPEGFLRVLETTGVAAEEALVFEDSQAGFTAAVTADIEFLDARQFDWASLVAP
jgi:HAD superfamily hydrolase (TIGR01509 family)